MKLNSKKIILLISAISLTNLGVYAAGMGMGSPCGGFFPPCPVPLDGGVGILLIAGAAYGGKKIYDSIKKNPE